MIYVIGPGEFAGPAAPLWRIMDRPGTSGTIGS